MTTTSIWPVLQRELRVESRRPVHHRLRMFAAAGMMAAFVVLSWGRLGIQGDLGGEVFGKLNALLFGAIWLIAPILTADAISSERREGTLGLLFLTPLTPPAVVISKTVAHALSAAVVFLAVLPVLTFCFALGGVTQLDVVTAVMFDFTALCLGLTAGLIASSFTKEWTRAVILAETLSLLFAILFTVSVDSVGRDARNSVASSITVTTPLKPMSRAARKTMPWPVLPMTATAVTPPPQFTSVPPDAGASETAVIFNLITGHRVLWSRWLALPAAGPASLTPAEWFRIPSGAAIIGLLAMILTVPLAAWRVQTSWREEPPGTRQQWIAQSLCTPLSPHRWFKRVQSWRLTHSPLDWLQQYAWSHRITRWGWCLGVAVIDATWSARGKFDELLQLQPWIALAVLVGISVSTANSFRRERNAGMLELLLVAPISEGDILCRRVWGSLKQILPASLLTLACWTSLNDMDLFRSREIDYRLPFISAAIALPFIGAYFSLRMKNFLSAWLMTLLCGVIIPVCLVQWETSQQLLRPNNFGVWSGPSYYPRNSVAFAFEAMCALFMLHRAHIHLLERRFAAA